MKRTILWLALAGLTTTQTVAANLGSDQWERSEVLWNDQYDAYVITATMSEDLFQERLVWSDHYADFIPVAMAYQAELSNYGEQLVWAERYGDFVPRAMVEPCPKLNSLS